MQRWWSLWAPEVGGGRVRTTIAEVLMWLEVRKVGCDVLAKELAGVLFSWWGQVQNVGGTCGLVSLG